MATIKDVAREAGVSMATVSNVLNGNVPVSSRLEKRVREAVEKVRYIPNNAARALKTQSTGLIGVVIFSNLNHYYSELLHWIDQECRRAGYSVLVSYPVLHPGNEIEAIKNLVEQGVEGVILNGIYPDKELTPLLLSLSIPVLLLHRNLSVPQCDVVQNDDYGGAVMAAEHLISLGHRRIAVTTYLTEQSHSFCKRLDGYRDALKGASLEWNEDLVYLCDFSTENGYDAFQHFFSLKNPPSAILCGADVLAMGIYKGAFESGLVIPRDLSVVGFDNISYSDFMIPPLTTIHQEKKQMSSLAVKTLLQRIKSPDSDTNIYTVPCRLVRRDSTMISKNDFSP